MHKKVSNIFKLLNYGTVTTFVLITANLSNANFVSTSNASVARNYSGDLIYMDRAFRQAPGPEDDPLNFIYNLNITSSLQDQDPRWQAASAKALPFNDSYWPTYKGIISYRYMDRANIPNSKAWSDHYHYYQTHPAENYLGSSELIRKLSPAEKYDLLVGNRDWQLTRSIWKKGETYLAQTGKNVPTWFGICHGWAASSHMLLPLPLSSVNVVGANGVNVTFSPTDLRALQSYLWAENAPQAYYVGRRCKSGAAVVGSGPDGDPFCLDNNPMSWHITATHRIGRDGNSLVMDTSGNAEVWNYAVDSYYFRYFNPKTLKSFRSWKDAVVSRSQFLSDPFSRLRTETTIYIVGVEMDVFYPSAIEPRENTSANRIYQNRKYIYDLELNDKFEIVGGEWHTNDRPDFLWTFAEGARALTAEDMVLGDVAVWSVESPLPQDWMTLAQKAAKRGSVLGRIVEHLVQVSQLSGPQGDGEDEEIEL